MKMRTWKSLTEFNLIVYYYRFGNETPAGRPFNSNRRSFIVSYPRTSSHLMKELRKKENPMRVLSHYNS